MDNECVKCDSDNNAVNKKNVVAYISRFYEDRKKLFDEQILTGSDKSGNFQIDNRLFARLLLKLKSSEHALHMSLVATFPFMTKPKKSVTGHDSVNWRQLTSELLPSLVMSLLFKRGNDKPISRIKTLLLIFKLLLTFVEDGADTSGNFVPIPKCATFWYSGFVSDYELGNIARREEELVLRRSLLAEPRVLVCYGKPSGVKNMEVTGHAMGIIAGIAVSIDNTQPCLNYYEVTITSDNPKDIKIGWAINGKNIPSICLR